MTYAKSDFVPGDEIIFEDDVTREQIGEFLSQWDLLKGTVEIAQINGDKVILCVSQDDPVIAPLFDNMKSYLPEKFTLEFDFWVGPFTENLRSGLSVINLTIRLISPILSGLMVDLPTSKVMPYVMNLPSLIMRSYNGTAPLATRMLRMEVLFVKYPPPL